MTESGMSNRCWFRGEFVGGDAGADQRQREVADHLARRRHLHQPAQHPVGGGVVGLDLLEAIPEPERDGLLAQVRQLAARESRGGTPGPSGLVGPDAATSKGAYTFRSASQYGSRSHTADSDSPVSYSVCAAAATIELSAGWLVVPANGAEAPSTALAPACQAAR